MHWRGSETGTRRPRSRPQFPNLPRCPPARCSAPRAVRYYRPAPRYMRARARTHARTHAACTGSGVRSSGVGAVRTYRPTGDVRTEYAYRALQKRCRARPRAAPGRPRCKLHQAVRCGAVRTRPFGRREAKRGQRCAGARSIVPAITDKPKEGWMAPAAAWKQGGRARAADHFRSRVGAPMQVGVIGGIAGAGCSRGRASAPDEDGGRA